MIFRSHKCSCYCRSLSWGFFPSFTVGYGPEGWLEQIFIQGHLKIHLCPWSYVLHLWLSFGFLLFYKVFPDPVRGSWARGCHNCTAYTAFYVPSSSCTHPCSLYTTDVHISLQTPTSYFKLGFCYWDSWDNFSLEIFGSC